MPPDINLPPAGAGVTGMCTEEHREFVQEVEETLNNGRNEGSLSVDIPDCADIYVAHEEPIADHIIVGEFDPETRTSENMKVSPNGDLMTLSTSTQRFTEMPGVFRPDAVARAREIIGAYTPAEPATDAAPPAEEDANPSSPSERSGEGQTPPLTPERRLQLQQMANMLRDLMQLEDDQTPPSEGSGEGQPPQRPENLTPEQYQLLEQILRLIRDRSHEMMQQRSRWS